MRKRNGSRGAISVFLSIILVPCIVISCAFVDVSRVHLAKISAESSADLALNTLLTNYDADLKDWYGMVASCQNIDEFYEISADYFLRAISSRGMSDDEIILLSDYYANATQDDTIYDLLRCKNIGEVKVSEVSNSTLSNPAMIKDQVVEFMKYRAPIEITKGIIDRFSNMPGMEDAIEAEQNEPMIEDKKEYYEAHGDMISKAYYSYFAIRAYWEKTIENKDDPFSNEKLDSYYASLSAYQKAYKEIMPYVVKNLTNTSGLSRYNRITITLDQYNDKYSDPEKYFSEVYSKKKKEGGSYKYYIDIEKVEKLVDALRSKRDEFNNAKATFGTNAQPVLALLPFGQGPDDSNPIQWWVKMNAAVSGQDPAVRSAAKAMMEAYSKVLAIDKCELTGDLPGSGENKWTSLDQWKEKYGANALMADVVNLQRRYLSAGVDDTADNYLHGVKMLESVSAAHMGNINAANLYINYAGSQRPIPDALSEIKTELSARHKELEDYIKLLNTAIDGDAEQKVPSMDELKIAVQNAETKLAEWKATTGATDTNMQKEISEEIENLERLDITVEQVDALKTRLVNIRSQLQGALDAIETLKLGEKSVKDIETIQDYISNAGVNGSYESITNAALDSYAERLFAQQFKPDTLPSMQHKQEAVFNVMIDPSSEQVETPRLFITMHKEFKGCTKDQMKEKEDDEKGAKNKGRDEEKRAKDKHYRGEGQDVPHEFSAGTRAESLDGIMGVLKKMLDGEFTGMRDSLFATTYVMQMFSWDTYDNEGMYNLLKDKSPDKVKELTLANYPDDQHYGSVKGNADTRKSWCSTNVVDSYNKSLTNKHICKNNNRAFEGEVEYILLGGTNEQNIKDMYGKLYGIRYGLNLVSGFQHFWTIGEPDNITADAVDRIAFAVNVLTQGIVPIPVTKAVLIPLLTVFETGRDTDRLAAGFPVEIYKSSYKDWWIAPETSDFQKMSDLLGSLGGANRKNTGEGVFYSDYMMLFLYLGFSGGAEDAMYQRVAEVIQANIAQAGNLSGYSLSKSRMYFNLQAEMKVEPLMTTLPFFSYDEYSNDLDTKTDWCTYKINITRGY